MGTGTQTLIPDGEHRLGDADGVQARQVDRWPASGTVSGMANTRKVTVTLPVATLDAVRRLVEAGQAGSVSGFVQHAVGASLDDVAGWDAALADALASTGGELSSQERAWADAVL